MISYAEAKRRAQAAKPNWNEEEYIAKAIIYWSDAEYENGLEIENDPHISLRQGYLTEESYDHGYSNSPGFAGIKAPTQLDYRYYNEDAGYGLVLWLDLADRLGLELPNVRAMLQIVSSIMGRDYRAEKARTLDTLGLSGYSIQELLKIL